MEKGRTKSQSFRQAIIDSGAKIWVEIGSDFDDGSEVLDDQRMGVKWLTTDQEFRDAITAEDLLPGGTIADSGEESFPNWQDIIVSENNEQVTFDCRDTPASDHVSYDELFPIQPEPPKPAEVLAYFFLSRTDRQIILGDLVEEYPDNVVKFGPGWAKAIFYAHVFAGLWLRFRKFIIRWGLFGWVLEIIRRKIGW